MVDLFFHFQSQQCNIFSLVIFIVTLFYYIGRNFIIITDKLRFSFIFHFFQFSSPIEALFSFLSIFTVIYAPIFIFIRDHIHIYNLWERKRERERERERGGGILVKNTITFFINYLYQLSIFEYWIFFFMNFINLIF